MHYFSALFCFRVACLVDEVVLKLLWGDAGEVLVFWLFVGKAYIVKGNRIKYEQS
jgi:hypothetical protein